MQIKNLTKKYRNNSVLNNITVDFSKETTLIIGKNGSGKTTLFKILGGIIKNYNGKIEETDNVSLLLDIDSLFMLKTGMENLEYFLSSEELLNATLLIQYFEINSYVSNIVKTYSSGMKKKLMLVIAFSRNKDVILLDEPTNSLDAYSVDLLKKYLKKIKGKKKVLIASHDISIFDKQLIDEIYMLKNGNLVTKNVALYDYTIFKIITKDKIVGKYSPVKTTLTASYFKISNGDIEAFSKYISKFIILHMSPITYLDELYLMEVYNE